MTDTTLTILVAGPDDLGRRRVEDALADAGDIRVVTLDTAGDMLEDLAGRVAASGADAMVAALGIPDPATLDALFGLARSGACAVVLFADHAERCAITDAAEAGVAAFVVDGVRRDHVRVIVDTALSRYAAFETPEA